MCQKRIGTKQQPHSHLLETLGLHLKIKFATYVRKDFPQLSNINNVCRPWIVTCHVTVYCICLCLSICVHVLYVTCRWCFCLFLFTHQPGAWLDSLDTDVNKLCLTKSQTQNVCEHNCIQSHMSLLVFHPFHELVEKSTILLYSDQA